MMFSISFIPEPLTYIGTMPLTNTLVTSWLVVAVLVIFGVRFVKQLKAVPGSFQGAMEVLVEQFFNIAESTLGNKKLAKDLFPFIITFFLYILLANWMGIMPGFSSIGLKEVVEGKDEIVPFLRSVNSDINMTLGLALISVIATQLIGIKALGLGSYLKKFFNFSSVMGLFTGLLEFIGEFTKIISFSFRLFGNIFGGEVLLIIIGLLLPLIAPLPFYGLEVMIDVIQAFIFAVLTMAFIRIAVSKPEH